MRVLPIKNSPNYVQHKTVFQARTPNNLVKQMQGKAEALKNLEVKTKAGLLFSLPAAAVAKLYSMVSDNEDITEDMVAKSIVSSLPKKEELKQLTPKTLVMVSKMQNEDGETIFHRDYDDEILDTFNESTDYEEKAQVLSLVDKNNQTAYKKNGDHQLGYMIESTAASGELSYDESLKLLDVNGINDNLTTFLKARKELKSPSSAVSNNVFRQLIAGRDLLYIKTGEAKYRNIPITTAARLFEYDGYSTLNLSEASTEDLRVLMKSVLEMESDPQDKSTVPIKEVMNEIKEEDKNRLVDVTINIVPEPKTLSFFTEDLDKEQNLKLYTQLNENNENLMHTIAKQDRNYKWYDAHFDLLGILFDEASLSKILLQRNNEGEIPAVYTSDMARSMISELKCSGYSNLVAEAFKNQNRNGDTYFHKIIDADAVDDLFEVLEDQPDALAEIFSIKNNEGLTAYNAQRKLQNAPSEEVEYLKDKIVELATDSDLSVEKSIELLEKNNIEPQIQEYLKLQANINKS